MSAFKTNPWDIGDLLSLMDKRKIVLPEFQRSFVWRPADIDLLITSLVQDFPAGSLLFLRADGSSELAWRPVEGVPETGSAVAPDYLVLDGQQRLTSLSVALNARGDHVFFMDLKHVEQDDLDNGVYALRRSEALKRGLFERQTQFERHTYPLWAVVGEGTDDWWFQDYAQYHAEHDGGDLNELRERARRLQEQFVNPLKKYKFPVVELPAETSLEAVCQIFETLNKTGMKLTVFDLITAKFWPKGLNLREMYEQSRDDYPLLGEEEFNIEPVLLLQAIALLRSGLCKRGDLLQLGVGNFAEDWERVCSAASAALGMLRSECGVLTRQWLPYGALCPALFAVTTRLESLTGPAVGAAWEKIKRWFWCSCFGQRYEGPQNTLNATDTRQLTAWIERDDQTPEAVSAFSLADLDLGRVERQRNAIYRAVICLTIVNGARDFHTGNRLTPDFLNDPTRRVEDHHIFATAYLRKQIPPRAPENSVLNRCLIDNVTNRLIGDKPPSVYMREIESHLGAERLEDVLTSHLIPTGGPGALSTDDVDGFRRARAELLLKAISSVTGVPLHADAGVPVYLDPARPFTNELALRRVIRGLHGRVLWYEQHMSRKNLEPLIEEIDPELVNEIRLLSGPANVTERVQRSYESFAVEMQNNGINVEWKVLAAEKARDIHARVLFDDTSAWELPPLNSLYKGTVDSIHPSAMPREPFEQAWLAHDSVSIAAFEPRAGESVVPTRAENSRAVDRPPTDFDSLLRDNVGTTSPDRNLNDDEKGVACEEPASDGPELTEGVSGHSKTLNIDEMAEEGAFPGAVARRGLVTSESDGRWSHGSPWDEESLLHRIEEHHGKELAAVGHDLFEWARRREALIRFGGGTQWATAYFGLESSTGPQFPFSLWASTRSAGIGVQFGSLAQRPPFETLETRKALQAKLNEISAGAVPDERLDKYPSLPLSSLIDPSARKLFFDAADWTLGEVREDPPSSSNMPRT